MDARYLALIPLSVACSDSRGNPNISLDVSVGPTFTLDVLPIGVMVYPGPAIQDNLADKGLGITVFDFLPGRTRSP